MQLAENTIAGQITETLRDAIISDKIAPGSKLSEHKLALEQRDTERAEMVMRKHIVRARLNI